jgi:hypothetical protein
MRLNGIKMYQWTVSGKVGHQKLTENSESADTERNELANYASECSNRYDSKEFQEH